MYILPLDLGSLKFYLSTTYLTGANIPISFYLNY